MGDVEAWDDGGTWRVGVMRDMEALDDGGCGGLE